MENWVKRTLQHREYLRILGVDPGKTDGCGICLIDYFPPVQILTQDRAVPLLWQSFKPLKHKKLHDFGLDVEKLDHKIDAIAFEDPRWVGITLNAFGGIRQARGMIEQEFMILSPTAHIMDFLVSEWRKIAYGHGNIGRDQAKKRACADFDKAINHSGQGAVMPWDNNSAEAFSIAKACGRRLCDQGAF